MSYLGVDYGEKNVGLAISSFGEIAQPLGVFPSKSIYPSIQKIVEENKIQIIVVGLPEGRLSEKVLKFVARLKQIVKVQVEMVDETLTSYQAQKDLIASGASKKKRGSLDGVAACLILEEYLEKNKT